VNFALWQLTTLPNKRREVTWTIVEVAWHCLDDLAGTFVLNQFSQRISLQIWWPWGLPFLTLCFFISWIIRSPCFQTYKRNLHKTWLKTAKMSIEDFLQCLSLPVPYINRVSSVSSFIFSSDVQSLLSLLWNKKFVLLNVLLNSYCEWTFYFLISSNLCETRFILLSQQWKSCCAYWTESKHK